MTTVAALIPKHLIHSALKSASHSAKAADLVYVNCNGPGYRRVKKGRNFQYFDGDVQIKDKDLLQRFRSLVIPPAWEDVWICKSEKGHLQVTGYDVLHRKQYRYHPQWRDIRSHTKYYRLLDFGRHLPAIRARLGKDLSLPAYPKEKILALAVSLMERTGIRIGNAFYEKLYGSFGLTTLKNRHAALNGSEISFSFKGKKGVQQEIKLKSRKLAKLVQACKDIPGKELFEYIDAEGLIHHIDSGMVNSYIHEISGSDFSAKDFRTWSGSLLAMSAFKDLPEPQTAAEAKAGVITVLDLVAEQLGNTRTVCKKYYVHPLLMTLYENKELKSKLDKIKPENIQGLNAEEEMLICLLN